jgi:hypothetical protein
MSLLAQLTVTTINHGRSPYYGDGVFPRYTASPVRLIDYYLPQFHSIARATRSPVAAAYNARDNSSRDGVDRQKYDYISELRTCLVRHGVKGRSRCARRAALLGPKLDAAVTHLHLRCCQINRTINRDDRRPDERRSADPAVFALREIP